jgi:hypothetical protein
VWSWHNSAFKSGENILHRNLSFIDYIWCCHLRAQSLASEVHGKSYDLSGKFDGGPLNLRESRLGYTCTIARCDLCSTTMARYGEIETLLASPLCRLLFDIIPLFYKYFWHCSIFFRRSSSHSSAVCTPNGRSATHGSRRPAAHHRSVHERPQLWSPPRRHDLPALSVPDQDGNRFRARTNGLDPGRRSMRCRVSRNISIVLEMVADLIYSIIRRYSVTSLSLIPIKQYYCKLRLVYHVLTVIFTLFSISGCGSAPAFPAASNLSTPWRTSAQIVRTSLADTREECKWRKQVTTSMDVHSHTLSRSAIHQFYVNYTMSRYFLCLILVEQLAFFVRCRWFFQEILRPATKKRITFLYSCLVSLNIYLKYTLERRILNYTRKRLYCTVVWRVALRFRKKIWVRPFIWSE